MENVIVAEDEIIIEEYFRSLVELVNEDKSLKYLKRALCELLGLDEDTYLSDSVSNKIPIELVDEDDLSFFVNMFLNKAKSYGQLILAHLLQSEESFDPNKSGNTALETLFDKIQKDSTITSSTEEKQKEFPKEFCYMLASGIINMRFRSQYLPAINQEISVDDYKSYGYDEKNKLHLKDFSSFLNNCFGLVYNGNTLSNYFKSNYLDLAVSKETKAIFLSCSARMLFEQNQRLNKQQYEVREKLKDIDDRISDFNAKLIEIIGIIIAIFSIIGLNVFTLAQEGVNFSPIELIEINLSVVLFIIVLLGVATKLLTSKKMPKSYWVVSAVVVLLLLVLFFKNEAVAEIILKFIPTTR